MMLRVNEEGRGGDSVADGMLREGKCFFWGGGGGLCRIMILGSIW